MLGEAGRYRLFLSSVRTKVASLVQLLSYRLALLGAKTASMVVRALCASVANVWELMLGGRPDWAERCVPILPATARYDRQQH